MRLANCLMASVFALLAGLCPAEETVVLKDGRVFEGTIVRNNKIRVEINQGGKTHFIDQGEIERIEDAQATAAKKRAFEDKMKAEGRELFDGKWLTVEEKKAEQERLAARARQRREERESVEKTKAKTEETPPEAAANPPADTAPAKSAAKNPAAAGPAPAPGANPAAGATPAKSVASKSNPAAAGPEPKPKAGAQNLKNDR